MFPDIYSLFVLALFPNTCLKALPARLVENYLVSGFIPAPNC
jgi:hypothetical protein